MPKPLAGGHALKDRASLQHERTVDDHIGDALGHLCRIGVGGALSDGESDTSPTWVELATPGFPIRKRCP